MLADVNDSFCELAVCVMQKCMIMWLWCCVECKYTISRVCAAVCAASATEQQYLERDSVVLPTDICVSYLVIYTHPSVYDVSIAERDVEAIVNGNGVFCSVFMHYTSNAKKHDNTD